MSELNPDVLAKLEAFGRRRRKLILLRGICTCLLSLIAAMLLIASVDWMIFLSDTARWIMSAVGYGFVVAIYWYTCLRDVWRIPDAAGMARLFESAEPRLREDLISAVELSDSDSERSWDSDAFRSFLQQDIAHKMSRVDVQSLLPWQLIQRWISYATAASVLLMMLLCVPGLHLGTRLARALFPIAGIERVSSTRIEIVAPDPPNAMVAEGESIDVVVGISGPSEHDDVSLETILDDGETSIVPMTRVSQHEPHRDDDVPEQRRLFQSTLRIGRQSMDYRIWANDARSQKHRIVSRQRPQVETFQKTYRYPDYLSRADVTASEPSGDLAGVVGTYVDLVIEVNQPITLAHMQVNLDGREHSIHLTPEIDQRGVITSRLRGTVLLDGNGTYRIHLVAADSGLENKFSPEYIIRSEPDVVPTISISEPSPAILVPADEIVKFVGTAQDDWALDRIEQHTRIGDGDWEITTLQEVSEGLDRVDLESPWDLYPLALQPGEVVFTKLVAIDRKGSKGESRTIRAVISSHEFDPRRWEGLENARAAHHELVALSESAHELKQATGQARNAQDIVAAMALADAYDQQAITTLAAIHTAIKTINSGRESIDLVLVGQAVSQASTVGVGFVRNYLASSSLDDARKAAGYVKTKTAQAASAYDQLLRLSEEAAVASDLSSLSRLQREAIARAQDNPERIADRMSAIGSQAIVLSALVDSMTVYAPRNVEEKLGRVRDHLSNLKALGDPFAGSVGLDAASESGEALRQSLAETMKLFESDLKNSVGPRRSLIKAAGATHETVRRAAGYARQLQDEKRVLGEQAAGGRLDQLQENAEKTRQTRDVSAAAFDAALSELSTLSSLEEKRKDSDSQFVADTSRARRGLEAIRARTLQGGVEETQALEDLDRLAAAIEALNVVHQLDDLTRVVTHVAKQEKRVAVRVEGASDADSVVYAFAAQSSDWFFAEAYYESLIVRLRKADLSDEALLTLQRSQSSNDYRFVRHEMTRRPQLHREPTEQSDPLAVLLADLGRVRALLSPILEQAREALQQLSPRIDQVLAALAQEVREEAEETRQLAQTAAEPSAELEENSALAEEEGSQSNPLDETLQQQLEELQRLAAELEEARAALREDAAEQNAMSEEGRARMRDDDDALALLEDQPQDIQAAMEEARAGSEPQSRQEALDEAAHQQESLAERLQQLAEHFENLERGEAEESRAQLRGEEERLGIDEALEAQEQQLAQLAALAELPPDEALAQLQEELAGNREMQQELDDLSREQIRQAQAQLEAAAARQHQQAEQFEAERGPQPGDSPQQLTEQLQQLASETTALAEQNIAQVSDALEDHTREQENPFRRDDPDGADENSELENSQAVAQQLEETSQQLAEAGQQAERDASQQEASAVETSRAAETLAEALRDAAEQLQQVAEQTSNESRGAGEPQQSPDDERGQDSASAGDMAQQAANRAERMADRADRLAEAIDDASDSWNDEPQSQASQSEGEADAARQDPAASDVWNDPVQEAITDAVEQAQAQLEQAARNQERLENFDLAAALGEITQETEEASRILDQFAEEASESEADVATQDRDPGRAAERASDVADQLARAEQAIAEPASELSDLLDGSASLESVASESGDRGTPSGDSSEESATDEGTPSDGGSDSEAAVTGDSTGPSASAAGSEESRGEAETGSEPASNTAESQEPGAQSSPSGSQAAPGANPTQNAPTSSSLQPESASSLSENLPLSSSAAQQLAEALNALDSEVFDELGLGDSANPTPGEPGTQASAANSGSAQSPGAQGQEASPTDASGSPPVPGPSSQSTASSSAGEGSESASRSEGTPQGEPEQPAQPEQSSSSASNRVSEAIAAAANAQAQQFAEMRSSAGQPSDSPSGQGYTEIASGAAVTGSAAGMSSLPAIEKMTREDWAKLPPKLAKDMLDGSREKVSPEYRRAVEMYFQLIAEKARKQK